MSSALEYYSGTSCMGSSAFSVSASSTLCGTLSSGTHLKIFCDVSTPYVEFYSDEACTTATSATAGSTCPYLLTDSSSCPLSSGECFEMIGQSTARYRFTCPSSPPRRTLPSSHMCAHIW